MSISAVNDSKVDLPNTLEVQNDQMIFAAAFPHIAENLTEIVIGSVVGVVAFYLNSIIVPFFCALVVGRAAVSLIATAAVIRSSEDSVEFNELLKSTLEKTNNVFNNITLTATVLYILFH